MYSTLQELIPIFNTTQKLNSKSITELLFTRSNAKLNKDGVHAVYTGSEKENTMTRLFLIRFALFFYLFIYKYNI